MRPSTIRRGQPMKFRLQRNRYLKRPSTRKSVRAIACAGEALLARKSIPVVSAQPTARSAVRRSLTHLCPQGRRVYALDPSVGKSLTSIEVNETTLSVPWDDSRSPLSRCNQDLWANISRSSTSIRHRTRSTASRSERQAPAGAGGLVSFEAILNSTSRWSTRLP